MDDDETVGGFDEEPEPADVSDEEDEGGQPQPPQLLGGKFKSADDLLHAYQELERTMHGKSTVNSAMTRQLADWGFTVDETTGQVIPPQQMQQEPIQQDVGGSNDPKEVFLNEFWENPFGALAKYSNGVRSIEKKANANTKREIAKLKSQPLYGKVADMLEADLSDVPDHILADAHQAERIVADYWTKAVGKYALESAKAVGADPAARVDMLKNLGIGDPEPEPENRRGPYITAGDREMFAEMGYSDAKIQETLAKRAREREKEAK